jgi:hypothetical protein
VIPERIECPFATLSDRFGRHSEQFADVCDFHRWNFCNQCDQNRPILGWQLGKSFQYRAVPALRI